MSAANLLTAFVASLAAYGALRWAIFASITFVLVRYTGWLGMFISHCVVAVLIAQHDIAWIQEAMKAPGWDGAPDMDLIFWIGVAVRVVIVNCLLLPIALISYRYRVRDAINIATQTPNHAMERTAGSLGSSPSMKFHSQPAATRFPASRRSSCSR